MCVYIIYIYISSQEKNDVRVEHNGTKLMTIHSQWSKGFVKALQLAVLRDDDAVPCLVILRSSGSTQHLHPWQRL